MISRINEKVEINALSFLVTSNKICSKSLPTPYKLLEVMPIDLVALLFDDLKIRYIHLFYEFIKLFCP